MSVTINGTTGITTPDVNSDGLTVDTTTLVVDETNNRVGIGTASPGAKLQVTSGGAYGPGSNLAQNLGQFTSSGGIAYVTMGNADSADQCRYIGAASAIQVFGKVTDAGSTTEHMRIDADGNLKFNSGFGSVGFAYGCRAWVSFNGTGTVAIRGSGNVSSITDTGTGDYTVNLTNAMPDTNYAVSGTAGSSSAADNASMGATPTSTSAVHVETWDTGNTKTDWNYTYVMVYR